MGQQQKPSNGLPQSESAQHKTMRVKQQNDNDTMPSSSSSSCIKFLINLLIYAICILSLSISVYLSYRHQQLENNVKSLMYLDNRVVRLEFELNELIRSQQQRRDTSQDDGVIISTVDDGKGAMVQRYYSEITRLKRDVSTLRETTKRQQRQTSPNENCMCPPGESSEKQLTIKIIIKK
jgi:hypothetical protein